MFRAYLLFFVIFASTAFPQPWDWFKAYPKQYWQRGESIGLDHTGNIYVGGPYYFYTGGGGSFYDYRLRKFNSSGTVLWEQSVPGANKAITDSAGNTYLLNGYSFSKYDNSGNVLWASQPFPEYFNDIIFYKNGLAVSMTLHTGNTTMVSFVYGFDTSGNLLWKSDTLPSSGPLVSDKQGNIYLGGGGPPDSVTGNRGRLSKIDSTGHLQFVKSVPHFIIAIATDSKGQVYATGWNGIYSMNVNGTIYPGTNDYRSYLMKYDQQGNIVWGKVSSGQWIRAGALTVDNADNVLLTGDFHILQIDSLTLTANNNGEFFLLRLSEAGQILDSKSSVWQNTPGGVVPYAMISDQSGSIYITGEIDGSHSFDNLTLSVAQTPNLFLAKLQARDVSSVSEVVKSASAVSVYPNPSEGIFTLSLASEHKQFQVKVSSSDGRIVYDQTIERSFDGNYVIDLGRKAKGVYLVEVLLQNSRIVKKIILE